MQTMHAGKHEHYDLSTQESEALRNRPEERYLFTSQVSTKREYPPQPRPQGREWGQESTDRCERLTRTLGFPRARSWGHHDR